MTTEASPTKQDYFRLIHTYTENENRISSETKYYLKLFEKVGNKGFFVKWNWFAFLLGPCWLIYRRVYLFGFAVALMFSGASRILDYATQNWEFLIPYSQMTSWILSVLWICIAISLGLLGNAIYFRSLRKRISKDESFGGTDGITVILLALWVSGDLLSLFITKP